MSVTEQSAHELYRAAFAPRPDLDAATRSRLRRVALGTDVLGLLAGGWLLCAPLVLHYTAAERGSAPFHSAVVTGGAIALAALIGTGSPLGGWLVRLTRVALGGWLVIAPAILGVGSGTAAVADEIAVGVVTAVLALVGLRAAVLARRLD